MGSGTKTRGEAYLLAVVLALTLASVLPGVGGCQDGTTSQPACAEGDYRCTGGNVERCSSGTWEFVLQCAADELCAGDGTCVDEASQPCEGDDDCGSDEACIGGYCKSKDVRQYAISGLVLDGVDDTGISDVEVSVEGSDLADVTDSSGQYALPTLSEGEYRISFKKSGYLSRSHDGVALFGADKAFDTYLIESVNWLSGTISSSKGWSENVSDKDCDSGDFCDVPGDGTAICNPPSGFTPRWDDNKVTVEVDEFGVQRFHLHSTLYGAVGAPTCEAE